jgi:hypothetical protein
MYYTYTLYARLRLAPTESYWVSLYDAHIKFILLYARLRLAAGDV